MAGPTSASIRVLVPDRWAMQRRQICATWSSYNGSPIRYGRGSTTTGPRFTTHASFTQSHTAAPAQGLLLTRWRSVNDTKCRDCARLIRVNMSRRLYVFGGRGRTRTDADIFFWIFFLACIDLRAQLERDPESDRLGHPPPPTHHDPMKIYRVYRYLHAQKYTLFVDLHV